MTDLLGADSVRLDLLNADQIRVRFEQGVDRRNERTGVLVPGTQVRDVEGTDADELGCPQFGRELGHGGKHCRRRRGWP